jgi:hypothetical protein
MTQQRVVIGSGPDGLRAAAALALDGHAPLLLQQGPGASGLQRPDLPEHDGRMRPQDRALAEEITGEMTDRGAPRHAVVRAGTVHALPLRPAGVRSLLPNHQQAAAAKAWLGARTRNGLVDLLGGGQEERTHRDWLVRRMGEPAWREVYCGYAERRWGMASTALGVGVARVHHFLVDSGPWLAPSDGPEAALRHAEGLVRGAGQVRSNVEVESLVVENGRVRAVRLSDGEQILVEGPLWIEDTPARVRAWLGDAAEPEIGDACRWLRAADTARIGLRGLREDLPDVLHLLDDDAPGWAVVHFGGGAGVLESTFPVGEAAPPPSELQAQAVSLCRRAGLGDAVPDGGPVEVLRAGSAAWGTTSHAALRDVVLAFERLGLVAVGGRGVFANLDGGEALNLLSRYRGEARPDQREALRDFVEPPVWLDDLGAPITRLITR